MATPAHLTDEPGEKAEREGASEEAVNASVELTRGHTELGTM